MTKIAIVILNWNGKKLLENFLPAVVENSPSDSIYIIDNGSTDDSLIFLTANYPKITQIPLHKNLGFAGGYNEGLKYIEATYYCLLNSDVLVTPNWLPPLLDHFDTNPNTAIIQPHILDYNNPGYFEYAGAAGGYIDRFGFPFCRGRMVSTIEKDEGQYDAPKTVFWASGACFFIRKSVFDSLDGFDSDFFAHQEEIDLCWRAQHQGHQIMSLGSSKVYHVGGASLPVSPRKVFLNHRNSLYMLVKNLPNQNYYGTLFVRLIIDGLIALVYLLQFKPKFFISLIKAHFIFYHNYSLMRRKRNLTPNSLKYFKLFSVLTAYYLLSLKKLTFFDK